MMMMMTVSCVDDGLLALLLMIGEDDVDAWENGRRIRARVDYIDNC